MKKIHTLLAALLIAVLFTAGCGSKQNQALLDQTVNNLNKAKTYSYNGNYDMVSDGQTQKLKFKGSAKGPNENYIRYDIDMMGQTGTNEIYQKDKNTVYIKTADKWQKLTPQEVAEYKKTEDSSPSSILTEIKNSRKYLTSSTKTMNGKEYKVLKIVLNSNDLKAKAKNDFQKQYEDVAKNTPKEQLKALQQERDQILKNIDNTKISQVYNLYIDPSSNQLTKIEMNQSVATSAGNQKQQNKTTMTLNFTDYNKPVKFPEVK